MLIYVNLKRFKHSLLFDMLFDMEYIEKKQIVKLRGMKLYHRNYLGLNARKTISCNTHQLQRLARML